MRTTFPDEERVNLGKFVSEVANKNNKKSLVERSSTQAFDPTRVNSTESNKYMTDGHISYADAIRTSLHKKIVREEMNRDLLGSEGQALGKPSEQSLTKLTKI